MLNITHLILLAEEYGRLEAVEEKTVSSRVFSDSKKLRSLRAGSDITVSRYNAALQWLSVHWPVDADWPRGIPRPQSSRLERAE
jgi:hypothetical protein